MNKDISRSATTHKLKSIILCAQKNIHIRNIYFDGNSTVIEFVEEDLSKDGLPFKIKKVKVEPNEEDLKKYGANPYLGFCIAFTKYIFGSNSEIKRFILDMTHPKYQDKVAYLKEEKKSSKKADLKEEKKQFKQNKKRDFESLSLYEALAESLGKKFKFEPCFSPGDKEDELKGEGTI